MANIDTAKQWFKTGDYPTQAQFYQLFEWLRWKDEKLSPADVEGLADMLNSFASMASMKALFRETINLSDNGLYTMPAGLVISGFVIESPADMTLQIGTTDGGSEIIADLPLTGDVPEAIATIIYAKEEKNIYFSGIVTNTKIMIIKNPA